MVFPPTPPRELTLFPVPLPQWYLLFFSPATPSSYQQLSFSSLLSHLTTGWSLSTSQNGALFDFYLAAKLASLPFDPAEATRPLPGSLCMYVPPARPPADAHRVLGHREEKVSLAVVLNLRNGPLMALQQDRLLWGQDESVSAQKRPMPQPGPPWKHLQLKRTHHTGENAGKAAT